MYKMIVQVLKCILKVYLGQDGAGILGKPRSKIKTIEPELDFPASYKKRVYTIKLNMIQASLTLPWGFKKYR